MSKNKYKVARRSVWYLMRTLLIIMAIIIMALAAFLTAMHVSNMYILATEGMQKRAESVLKDGSVLELTEYFTQGFIDGDEPLHAGAYSDFTISDYNYRLSIEGITVFPWSDSAKMRVVERITNLSGALNDTAEDQTATLPEWPVRRYNIIFSRIDTRWYISELELLEENPELKVKGTPDISQLEGTS